MARQRFPRAARLLDKAQFDAVFAARRRQQSSLFILHAASGGQDSARLGLAIAKRVVPDATQRNRLKRHAREAFRHHSYLSPVARAVLCGFGVAGYALAIDGLAGL